MTDLGPPDATLSYGYGINEAGQVAGYSSTGGIITHGPARAVLYSGGTVTELGTLGGTQS